MTTCDFLGHLRKNISTYYSKGNKMTLTEAVLVTLMRTLNIYLSIEINLKATIKSNLSKSRKFCSEISAVEFRYSEIIVFGIHTNLLMIP